MIIFPLETISIILPIIVFLLLRKWHNPAKIYYYTIAISNFISFIFFDIFIVLPITIYFLGNDIPFIIYFAGFNNFIHHLLNQSNVVCSILNFLADIGPLFENWTTVIFSIHKRFIVLFPLKTYFVKQIFNK